MPDNILKFEIQTIPNKELETITQSTYSNFLGVRALLTTEIISLKDIAIRDALVTLGWAPPKKKEIPKCCVCNSTENLHKDGWYGYRCDSPNCICF